jgi:hypothetical protein
MFQLHKKWKEFIIKEQKNVVINLHDLQNLAHLNLHSNCKHRCIGHK